MPSPPAPDAAVLAFDDVDLDSPGGGFSRVPGGLPAELDPEAIAAHLVETVDRFAHLREAEAFILVLMRHGAKVKSGRTILGSIAVPRFQGTNGDVAAWLLAVVMHGHMPDYILVLEAMFWRSATPMQREALVFHELCHTIHERDRDGELKYTESGRPVLGIRGHDLEEFNDVVRRYGCWLDDVRLFGAALAEGTA